MQWKGRMPFAQTRCMQRIAFAAPQKRKQRIAFAALQYAKSDNSGRGRMQFAQTRCMQRIAFAAPQSAKSELHSQQGQGYCLPMAALMRLMGKVMSLMFP